jgi:hypothetical protein
MYINFNMEEEMIKKQLRDLGFKRVRGTEPGIVMYELDPATLRTPSKMTVMINKPQASSSKPQAASNKRLDKSK